MRLDSHFRVVPGRPFEHEFFRVVFGREHEQVVLGVPDEVLLQGVLLLDWVFVLLEGLAFFEVDLNL